MESNDGGTSTMQQTQAFNTANMSSNNPHENSKNNNSSSTSTSSSTPIRAAPLLSTPPPGFGNMPTDQHKIHNHSNSSPIAIGSGNSAPLGIAHNPLLQKTLQTDTLSKSPL